MSWKFWKKKPIPIATTPEEDEAAYQKWYDEKTALMVGALGDEHDMVVHAIISYEVGGALHGYFYPHGIEGTGLATKQLARLESETLANEIHESNGPSNSSYDAYEFVMFTRDDLTKAELSNSPDDTYCRMRSLLNCFAPYAEQVTLNQYETIGIPEDWEVAAGANAILDVYKPENFNRAFGLMLIMEIFPSELEYKTNNGGDALIKLLKQAGHYPYSDLNRKPVA